MAALLVVHGIVCHTFDMRHWFKTPVSIWVGSSTKQVVSSAEEAARMLLHDWPDDAVDAKKAILAAMEGGPIDDAEAAFRGAAKAAGVLAD